ncbi:histamine H1 receptor [Brachionus plicatilis]|uniref:Histamine H1 receptor n=1 Tax=Brachionus plicatilis TaxID=10195 RepID=A0A3M7SUX4_BRAPC|nr:histamine H1 receptor [Brachionus plicatilis]
MMMNKSNQSEKIRLMDLNEIRILFGIIMGALCFVTIFGNIIVIYKYRKTSMVGNLFIISLACADLIVGIFVMPLATVYAINDVWILSVPVCLIWLSADYTASTASILNLLTLSLDRYWSITSPLEYLGKRTKSRALIMILIAWSISLLWLVPITGWPYFFNQGQRTVAQDKCNTEYDKNIFFKMSTAIINFYVPLIAMIAINTKIYLVIHKRYRNPIMRYSSIVSNDIGIANKSTTNRAKSLSICSSIDEQSQQKFKTKTNTNAKIKTKKFEYAHDDKMVARLCRSKSVQNFQFKSNECLHSKPNKSDSECNHHHLNGKHFYSLFTQLRKNSHQKKNCFSPKNRQKNGLKGGPKGGPKGGLKGDCKSSLANTNKKPINRKGFMNKQEKAFKQLSSIVIGFTFCFTPYFIVFLIVAICENCVSDEVFTVTVWLGYLNSTINPFLYALSNKRIKKENNNQCKINTTTTNEFYRRKSLRNARKSIW